MKAAPLLAIVLVIATAGLVYELAIAAVASYLLGDSVTQFSIIIGLYLSALGIGAYVSRFIERDLARHFVDVELAAALLGGGSAPGLFLAFSFVAHFHLVLYGTVLAVGILVGLELPLLIRILERELEFKELIARALTFDYAGALLGSLAFSLFLVPKVGLLHSSLVSGMLNAAVGLASTFLLTTGDPAHDRPLAAARVRAAIVMVLLAVGLLQANRVRDLAELQLFGGDTVVALQSHYQRIVLTRRNEKLQLFLNGNLQFSSDDEHRYHEALVHPAMSAAEGRRSVLIGGGGDGLGLREVLKWPEVERVTLVDLDPAMTALGRDEPSLRELNRRALLDPRVRIVNADAMSFFAEDDARYDVVLLDFPDPTNYALGKLYSTRFYGLVRERLAPQGALGVQATSPLFARHAYWCIVETLRAAGLHVLPYHAYLSSFGEWGYVLARHAPVEAPSRLPPVALRSLDADTWPGLFAFGDDMAPVPSAVNRLNNQALVAYYLDEWSRWN